MEQGNAGRAVRDPIQPRIIMTTSRAFYARRCPAVDDHDEGSERAPRHLQMRATSTDRTPIPAFVNPEAGTAAPYLKSVGEDPRFSLRATSPGQLRSALEMALADEPDRLAVAGGDGTLRTAAEVLAHTGVALAVLPAGTLNHFARHLDVPTEPEAALELAATGGVRLVDTGVVNGHRFLNTSSLGAYINFVRQRERLERWLGYRLASAVASVAVLWRLRAYHVGLAHDQEKRWHRTPLVFVGVRERELRLPAAGAPVEGGQRGLHVILAPEAGRLGLLASSLAALARGLPESDDADDGGIRHAIVDECRVDLPRSRGRIALDGELVLAYAPLQYRIDRRSLSVVAPPRPVASAGGVPPAS